MPREARIDDIALFFSNKKHTISKVWVPHDVYADPENVLGSSEPWRDTIVSRARHGKGSEPFFVTNLANLEPPGEPPTPEALRAVPKADAAPAPKPNLQPEPGDLVVIPFSDPDHAYLVRKRVYEDETLCPPIQDASGADLSFMALTEGVVLSNIPKQDLAGMTCYLLNLVALSGS